MAVTSPAECKCEIPYTGIHDRNFYKYDREKVSDTGAQLLKLYGMTPVEKPKYSTKEEFLKEWGKPDSIINNEANLEVWEYKRNIWCGVTLFVFIPVPFMLPVCDGFDKVSFKGNESVNLYTRRGTTGGFFIVMSPAGGSSGSGSDPACKYPIPCYRSVDSEVNSQEVQNKPLNDLVEDSPKNDKKPDKGPQTSVPYTKDYKVPDNVGLVVIYRPRNFVGSAGVHAAHLGNDLIIPLYDGSYYLYQSPLGENEFWMQAFFDKKVLKISVKPGQKYFIRFKIGFFKIYFEEVDAKFAEEELADDLKLISAP
jgi:hypothetical protein